MLKAVRTRIFGGAIPSSSSELLQIAESLRPTLKTTRQRPIETVVVKEDSSASLGWSATSAGPVDSMSLLATDGSVVIDFGGHRTGRFEFTVVAVAVDGAAVDAPARLRVTFGEILNDVAESFDDYDAYISKSWLPVEVVTVDYMPYHVEMPRRQAFRFVKIEVVGVSSNFNVKFKDCAATALTSAPLDNPPALTFKTAPTIGEAERAVFRRIDEVALQTLRDCMQTVYEDGPRRDRRLWTGDLRLQALCSYSTFKDFNLAKRCLYLFAALPLDDEGNLSADMYEYPEVHAGGSYIVDYSWLFSKSVLDYVEATGDLIAGRTLYPIAFKQLEIAMDRLTADFLWTMPPTDREADGYLWVFVDWESTLEKTVAAHGILVYALKALVSLAKIVGLPLAKLAPAGADTPLALDDLADKIAAAVRKAYFDADLKLFVSGSDRQVSWASNAWAVIGGITTSQAQAATALKAAYESEAAVIGATPFLHHELCQAFILAGLNDLALSHIKAYWGSMIDAGAETFFEGWNSEEPRYSPYGDLHANSFCHAWSCTPAYLLRELGLA